LSNEHLTQENYNESDNRSHTSSLAKTRLVTTQAVLLEIGNALSKQRYRYAAVMLLQALNADPMSNKLKLLQKLKKVLPPKYFNGMSWLH